MKPLLIVDGDSFAHRSYHALPKSIRRANGGPAGLLTGVGNLLVRLWEEEQPRAVLESVTSQCQTLGHALNAVVPRGHDVRVDVDEAGLHPATVAIRSCGIACDAALYAGVAGPIQP